MFQNLLHIAEAALTDQKPFVIYRKPRETQVKGIFQNEATLHPLKDFKESGFIFAPFQDSSPIIRLQPDRVVHAEPPTYPHSKRTAVGNTLAMGSGSEHRALVRKAINAIKNSDLRKVVLSTRFEVSAAQGPMVLFTKLLALYPKAFCYVWYHPTIGLWLGATPEILLSARGGRLTTMSLAGTLPVEQGKDPQWSPKEMEEQEMVTQHITSVLQEHCTALQRGPLETVQAGSLWHLRSKLHGSYEDGALGDIINALHPTPAVCGLPTNMAKGFLQQHEGYPREFYTGYLGELNMTLEKSPNARRGNTEQKAYRSRVNATQLYVNLRCMQLKDKKALVYVGGGITAASDPDMEWMELCNKSKTILGAFG